MSLPEAAFLVLVSKALDPPMEFVGDAYKLKKVAKHSAALQALNYLEAGSLPCRHFCVISPCPPQTTQMSPCPQKCRPRNYRARRIFDSQLPRSVLTLWQLSFPLRSCRPQPNILEGWSEPISSNQKDAIYHQTLFPVVHRVETQTGGHKMFSSESKLSFVHSGRGRVAKCTPTKA